MANSLIRCSLCGKDYSESTHEHMKAHGIHDSLNEALVAAQAEMPNPPLDGFNPHFKSKFSTLLAVRDTVVPIMNKHGIWVSQGFDVTTEGAPVLTTTLQMGLQAIVSRALIPPQSDIQKWAAAVTYMRRIALLSIAGVVGDPDADAEDVVRAPDKTVSPHPDTAGEDPILADKIADAFRTQMNVSNDKGVYQVHMDAREEGEEAYSAAWKLLKSGERTTIKRIIEELKAGT